jgi:hypothetical protein
MGWKSDKRSWWSTHRSLEQVVTKRSVIPHWFFRELTFLLSILLIYSACARRNGPGRHTLKKLRSFQVNEDFRIELYAAKPVLSILWDAVLHFRVGFPGGRAAAHPYH